MDENWMENDLLASIETWMPYDGPHTPEKVRKAGLGMSALVRYINNATGPGTSRTTLKHAATVDSVLASLHSVAAGLDQTINQLESAMIRQQDDPTLYDDRRGVDDWVGSDTAENLIMELGLVREAAAGLAQRLDTARRYSAHLGND